MKTLNYDSLPPLLPEPCRVLVLQRILAPYRLAFFQALARSPKLALTVAFGKASRESALESLDHPPGVETATLRNTYVGKNERMIWQSGTLSLLSMRRYDTVIAEFNPRIVTNILGCLLAQRRGLKFIFWGHGFRPGSGPIDKRIYLWLAARSAAVIFYTPAGASQMIARGMPQEKAFVAWNSIDTDEIDHLVEDFVPEKRFRILCIGRLIPEKKVDLLLRGFARAVADLKPGTKLTVIGEGPQRAALETLSRELHIDPHVEFVGSLYDQESLAPYFNTSSVSISTGYIGLNAVQSLAYGVPMIVADKEPHSPEIAVIEDGVNSLFFHADSAADLAVKLVCLLESSARLRQFSKAALTGIVRKFNLAAMVEAFELAVQHANEH